MSNHQAVAEQPKLTFIQKCRTMRGQQLICTVVFLIAPLLLLFVFTYLPFFKMVQFSFYDRDYLRVRGFVGLRNYLDVFTRDDCFQALKLSLYYMAGSVVQISLALLFATILSFKVRGSKFFRGALYFPCLICGIAVGFIFKFFLNPGFVLDTLLGWVGIIIPSIRTIVVLNLILSVSGALSAFEMPYVVTNGTFGTSTYFVVMNKLAHTDMKVGLASAMAVVLLVLIVAVTGVQKLAEKAMEAAENKPVHY